MARLGHMYKVHASLESDFSNPSNPTPMAKCPPKPFAKSFEEDGDFEEFEI